MAEVIGIAPNAKAFLSRKEASEYLKNEWNITLSVGSLTNMACRGDGPLMVYHSRFPRYSTGDLDTYAQSRITPRVRSTSEGRAARIAA